MKLKCVILLFAVFPAGLLAQNATVQMQCHTLASSGNYIGPDETVINGMACHPVSTATKAADPVSTNSELPASSIPAPSAPTPSVVVLPDSTTVKLALSEALSSANATQGQVIEFRVAEDVVVNGTVLIKKDTLALGKVTLAQGKRHLGRAGSLDIEADKTHAVDGSKVELHAEAGSKGKGKAGAMSAGMLITATGVGAPIGAFWLLKHGKDAMIPAGSILTAYTDDDVSVHVDAIKQIAGVR